MEDHGVDGREMVRHDPRRFGCVARADGGDDQPVVVELALTGGHGADGELVDQHPQRVRLGADELADDPGQDGVAAAQRQLGMEAQAQLQEP